MKGKEKEKNIQGTCSGNNSLSRRMLADTFLDKFVSE